MSELNSEIVNRLAREAGMTRAVGLKRNAWHGCLCGLADALAMPLVQPPAAPAPEGKP